MSYSIDINETNFVQEVIEASRSKPVVADFWATWCGPCKTLMPILEKLAEEYAGQFQLAKIETEQNQALANQFAIRSVPTVKIFANGEVVDEFAGALPEPQIREILEKHINAADNTPLQQAIALYQTGEADAALEIMQQLLTGNPGNATVIIELANMLMREKRFDEANQVIQSLPGDARDKPEAMALISQLDAINTVLEAPSIDELSKIVENEPGNMPAREQLSSHYVLRGEYEAAMEQLLEIVKRDRNYKEGYGRTELLKLFEILASNNELVSTYRRKLAQSLY